MSYIKENLIENEKEIYLGHRHWIVFTLPLVWLIVSLLFLQENRVSQLAFFPFIIFIVTLVDSTIDYFFSEIGVTNLRVMIKIGFFSRQSLETGLSNISSISVDQTFLGRLLGYGRVIISDVGSTSSSFSSISYPFRFRKAVLSQIETGKK